MTKLIGSASLTTTDSGTDLTQKGDLHGYSTSNTRIPVGSNDQVLTADSAQALGVKWATASSGIWSQLGTDSSDSGKAQLQVSFTMHDVLSVFFLGCSAGTTEDDIRIQLNDTGGTAYSMRGDYSSSETSFQAQANWSATFGNNTPQRPTLFQLVLWKKDANIVGDSMVNGIMLGAVNIDGGSSPPIVNTLASSGLLFDSSATIASLEVFHGSDNVIGNLQVNGMNYA